MTLLENGIIFSTKKKRATKRKDTWKTLREKATYCMIPTLWHSGKSKTLETVKRLPVVGCQRLEGFERHTDRTQILGH